MNTTVKQWILVCSGILGFIVPTYFAWVVYEEQIPQNVATWGMVFALDALGLILAYKGGNKEPYMQLGWAFAALCVFVAVLINGSQTTWGWTEIVSVILCCVGIVLWITAGPRVAQGAYVTALYISFVPLMIDYWRQPEPATIWVWLLSIATCLLAILGAKKYNFENTFIPWAAIPLNTIISVLCML